MTKIGAVYCVYDSSTFLYESVHKIYPLMDKIIFILNTKPWYGDPVPEEPFATYRRIFTIPDPDDKFEILTGTWENEASQRNVGLKLLKDRNIDWCLIIDDDELFNRSELKSVKEMLGNAVHAAYLVYHQIYWKNRNTIIKGIYGSFPTFARTDGTVHFNQDRMILVNSGYTWFSISSDNIVCHHMSYVRSDVDMYRKIKNFSHADDVIPSWYKEKWLKWNESMIDLHPILAKSFKRTMPISKSKYKLI